MVIVKQYKLSGPWKIKNYSSIINHINDWRHKPLILLKGSFHVKNRCMSEVDVVGYHVSIWVFLFVPVEGHTDVGDLVAIVSAVVCVEYVVTLVISCSRSAIPTSFR